MKENDELIAPDVISHRPFRKRLSEIREMEDPLMEQSLMVPLLENSIRRHSQQNKKDLNLRILPEKLAAADNIAYLDSASKVSIIVLHTEEVGEEFNVESMTHDYAEGEGEEGERQLIDYQLQQELHKNEGKTNGKDQEMNSQNSKHAVAVKQKH